MADAVVFNEYAAGGPIEQLNAALGNDAGINWLEVNAMN